MLISKAVGIVALALATLNASGAAHAAILETQSIENWTLNAYNSDKTGNFQSCSMKTAGNDQVYLTVSANSHNRWFLSLYRAKWDLEPDAHFIATLNLDQDRKQPIALDAKVSNDRYVSLALPPERHVLDLFSKATKARISREARAYTFSLTGYDKAVQWMKACVVRHNAEDVSKPDATIKGEDDETDAAGVEVRKDKPADTPKVAPKLPAGVLEVKASDPAKPDTFAANTSVVSTAQDAASTPAPTAKPPAMLQVANVPATASVPQMSDAAKASPMPVAEQPVAAIAPAQLLLPSLMAAANRADFKLLDASAAPAPLKHSDVVFSLTGMTGVVMAVDLPTAEAATNEVLAYDRIACAGAYSAVTDPVEDGHADVLRSMSECKSGDTSVLTHYLTLSKKAGGFFVVALTSETPSSVGPAASDKLAEADHALSDAARKVSGKF